MNDEREEGIEEGAAVLRDLLATLDLLSQCNGNKAKLELSQIACEHYLDLHDLCKQHRFTIAVGIDIPDDDLIHA